MKFPNVFIIAAITTFFASTPAKADTDYRCLNQCVNSGKIATVCMPECTYTPESSLHKEKDIKLSPQTNHNPFVAPAPVKDDFITSAPIAKPKHESEDYTCAAKCQQEGMQYQLCKRKCTKPDAHEKAIPMIH